MPLVELVPNFSEGRQAETIDALAQVAAGVAGVTLLDRTSDVDHNRTVLTLVAAAPEAAIEAAVALGGAAAQRIDLRSQQGVHPRIGAMDVCPFVPAGDGATLALCAELAQWAGNRLWLEHDLPVYFYEAAALRDECIRLEDVRRGAALGTLRPDVGGPAHHPTAGATAVGARRFLIAFNVNLESTDLSLARRIARNLRAASPGGLPGVKALGLPLPSAGVVQVSMNLVDHATTGIEAVYTAIETAAREAGVSVRESELIGLAPAAALSERVASRVRLRDWSPERMILERRLAANRLN